MGKNTSALLSWTGDQVNLVFELVALSGGNIRTVMENQMTR